MIFKSIKSAGSISARPNPKAINAIGVDASTVVYTVAARRICEFHVSTNGTGQYVYINGVRVSNMNFTTTNGRGHQSSVLFATAGDQVILHSTESYMNGVEYDA